MRRQQKRSSLVLVQPQTFGSQPLFQPLWQFENFGDNPTKRRAGRGTSQAPRTGRPFERWRYLVIIWWHYCWCTAGATALFGKNDIYWCTVGKNNPPKNPPNKTVPHSSLHPTQNLSVRGRRLILICQILIAREGIEGSHSRQMALNCLSQYARAAKDRPKIADIQLTDDRGRVSG